MPARARSCSTSAETSGPSSCTCPPPGRAPRSSTGGSASRMPTTTSTFTTRTTITATATATGRTSRSWAGRPATASPTRRCSRSSSPDRTSCTSPTKLSARRSSSSVISWSPPQPRPDGWPRTTSTPCSACAPGASSRTSDPAGSADDDRQRVEPVEPHGRVARGVGAGRLEADDVALGEVEREVHGSHLVEHVGAVAGRPREDTGSGRAAVGAGLDAVADRLLEGLDQTGEDAGVEVDPPAVAAFDHAHHGRHEGAGVADHGPPGLGDGPRSVFAEGLPQLVLDDGAVCGERRDVALVPRGEPAAEVEQPRGEPVGAYRLEHGGSGGDRAAPGVRVALLGADVEAHAGRVQAERDGEPEDVHGLADRTAVLAGQWPVGAVAGGDQAAEDGRTGRGLGDLPDLRRRVHDEDADTEGGRLRDMVAPLDGV